jgi:hypothetical protein
MRLRRDGVAVQGPNQPYIALAPVAHSRTWWHCPALLRGLTNGNLEYGVVSRTGALHPLTTPWFSVLSIIYNRESCTSLASRQARERVPKLRIKISTMFKTTPPSESESARPTPRPFVNRSRRSEIVSNLAARAAQSLPAIRPEEIAGLAIEPEPTDMASVVNPEVLSPSDVENFIELGYCAVRGAFTAAAAATACRCLWRRMEEKAGIRENDPTTWPPKYDIEEHLTAPEILACFSDRLAAGISQLLRADRWRGDRRWGLWPVNFSFGADQPYDFPTYGWHIDGNWFSHTIDCPKQGLLVIGLFTDVEPRWGGTILALGSHKQTARVLAAHPEGLSHRQLFREVLREPIGGFHEVTGAAGDVILAHPFLFHTKGFKHAGPPRILSNTEAGLLEPMNLTRSDPRHESILERSVRVALSEPRRVPQDARMCWFSSSDGTYQ